jgi:hypothetical protein
MLIPPDGRLSTLTRRSVCSEAVVEIQGSGKFSGQHQCRADCRGARQEFAAGERFA